MLRPTLMLMLCTLLLAACKKDAAETATAQADASADQATATASFDAGQVQMQSGGNLSVPADFPKDVYVPTGQTVENIVRVGPTTSLVFGADKPSASLMHDIETSMTGQGWTTTMSMQTGAEGSMLAFSKPERSVIYTQTQSNSRAQLTLQHTQETK